MPLLFRQPTLCWLFCSQESDFKASVADSDSGNKSVDTPKLHSQHSLIVTEKKKSEKQQVPRKLIQLLSDTN